MYTNRRSASAVYKLAISVIALIILWSIFDSYGVSALRLFPSWVLIITVGFYLVNALFIGLNRRRSPGRVLCPMLEGMIIISYLLILGMAAASKVLPFSMPPLNSVAVGVICGILPVMTLLDWAVFAKKGRWHTMSPFYWVALPVCYAATMIFTASFLPDANPLKYPLVMFNYLDFGALTMLWSMILIVLLDLVGGYVLYLLDFIISGQLAKKVVLPHLVVVED